MKITRFEELDCWKEARNLVNLTYNAIDGSRSFSKDFRLREQSVGAAISVMANIAEGFARRSNKEFIKFLFISISSAAELQSHMYVASDRGYVSPDAFSSIYEQAEKTSKLTSGLITYLRNNDIEYREKQRKE